jgi:hypothetical protein
MEAVSSGMDSEILRPDWTTIDSPIDSESLVMGPLKDGMLSVMISSEAKFSEYCSSALLDWIISSDISSSHFYGLVLEDLDLFCWTITSLVLILTDAAPDLPLCL